MAFSDCPIPGILVNRAFTSASAFFLGSLMAGDESYRLYGQQKRMWLSVTKHNVGYCTNDELQRHFEAVKKLTTGMDALMYTKSELVMRSWFTPNKQGFAAAFAAPDSVSSGDLCSFADNILKDLSDEQKKCMVLGAFDGRSSIDINKSTGDIRYIVLDCGNDDSMDILCSILSHLGIRFNCNYARDRLEGGEPRKPQLRIAAASVPRYAQMIGYISPARLSLLAKALGPRYSIVDNDELLPGLHSFTFSFTSAKPVSPSREVQRPVSPPKVISAEITKEEVPRTTPAAPKFSFDTSLVKEGAVVHHKAFGDGRIVSLDDQNHITISFNVGEKTFVYPDAFNNGFLSI